MTLPTLDSDVGSQLCLNHQRWPPPSGAKGTFCAFEMNGSVTEERVGDTATDRPALRVPSSRRADALFVAYSLVPLPQESSYSMTLSTKTLLENSYPSSRVFARKQHLRLKQLAWPSKCRASRIPEAYDPKWEDSRDNSWVKRETVLVTYDRMILKVYSVRTSIGVRKMELLRPLEGFSRFETARYPTLGWITGGNDLSMSVANLWR